jgi:hypothetical protein
MDSHRFLVEMMSGNVANITTEKTAGNGKHNEQMKL